MSPVIFKRPCKPSELCTLQGLSKAAEQLGHHPSTLPEARHPRNSTCRPPSRYVEKPNAFSEAEETAGRWNTQRPGPTEQMLRLEPRELSRAWLQAWFQNPTHSALHAKPRAPTFLSSARLARLCDASVAIVVHFIKHGLRIHLGRAVPSPQRLGVSERAPSQNC